MVLFRWLCLTIVLFAVAPCLALAAGEEQPLSALAVEARIPYLKRPASDVDRFLSFGFGALWFVVPPNLMRLDPADHTVTEIELEDAMTPGFAGIGEGAIWITDIASDLIFKVDPVQMRVVQRIEATGLYRDSMIGLGAGSLWAVTGNSAKVLTRFEAGSGKVMARIDLPGMSGPGAFYAFDSVWVVGERKRELYRINPASNSIIGTTPLHHEPFAASVDATDIWINNRNPSIVDRIDGKTGTVTASVETGLRGPENITTGAGYVWMSFEGSPLVQIDPQTNSVRRRYLKSGFTAIMFGADSLWLDDGEAILRISPPN